MEVDLFGIFKKALPPEEVAQKIVLKIAEDLCIIKPKLERLFDQEISQDDLASALVSSYLFQISSIGRSKNKSEVVKLVVNNTYNDNLFLYEETGSIDDWVKKFIKNNSEYADAFKFLMNKINSATHPRELETAALPLMAMLYEKLTGCDIELDFKPLMAEGGQEWFNELGVICGKILFDSRDFVRENKF
ncbi:MAG: hypothetical protein ACKOXK_08565 [Chakrabartia sp.]